jgi:methylase of polypeptide subunit release factors
MNGLWARLLKNNFAPLTVGQFDYIVGNPPWVNWEHLPDGYRDSY